MHSGKVRENKFKDPWFAPQPKQSSNKKVSEEHLKYPHYLSKPSSLPANIIQNRTPYFFVTVSIGQKKVV